MSGNRRPVFVVLAVLIVSTVIGLACRPRDSGPAEVKDAPSSDSSPPNTPVAGEKIAAHVLMTVLFD